MIYTYLSRQIQYEWDQEALWVIIMSLHRRHLSVYSLDIYTISMEQIEILWIHKSSFLILNTDNIVFTGEVEIQDPLNTAHGEREDNKWYIIYLQNMWHMDYKQSYLLYMYIIYSIDVFGYSCILKMFILKMLSLFPCLSGCAWWVERRNKRAAGIATRGVSIRLDTDTTATQGKMFGYLWVPERGRGVSACCDFHSSSSRIIVAMVNKGTFKFGKYSFWEVILILNYCRLKNGTETDNFTIHLFIVDLYLI